METRLRFLPIADVTEGMVLGSPLVLSEHGVSNFSLPAGHELTETNLRQMLIRHAEYVCIQIADQRSDEERAKEWASAEARVKHIFRSSNLNDPVLERLHNAVLAFRRT